MIITSITGGLGNQLFQYAMGLRLAAHHKTKLLLDTTAYGSQGEQRPEALKAFARPLALMRFKVSARAATMEEIRSLKDNYGAATTCDRLVRVVRRAAPRFLWKASHVIERQYRFQPEALDYPDNTYLQGFWQSPKYFADIAPVIREEFRPKDASIVVSASQRVAELRARHGAVVSLHIRRGDLAHAHEVLGRTDVTHTAPLTQDYIKAAMSRFSSATCFFVFSDSPKDIEWCKQNIRATNIEFSDASSDMWDLTAMNCCDHHIIANSTFSWWAAWLDVKGGRTVAPRVWSSPERNLIMETDDLLPRVWEILG